MNHPARPAHLPRYAELCLEALAQAGLSNAVSIGGALGLMHYLDYRTTHDADAWWSQSATEKERLQVIEVLRDTLADHGQLRTRQWRDVTSIELLRDGHVIFSFQIADRSAQLEPSIPAGWTSVLLDGLPDLVASKMVALVERGAPRDFRDIFAVCRSELMTPRQCWDLWLRRQSLAGGDPDISRARLAIGTHLARITLQRPLDRIADPEKRAEAESLRCWFREVFLHAPP